MRPNTLETDRSLLYRLGRGTAYLQLGSVLATATNSVAASGYGTDYPQQLTQLSWLFTGSAPVANAITVELFRGTTSVIVATIPVATVAGATGGVISAPIDDWDFASEAIVCLVTGNAGNPAGSLVALTAVLRPL